MKLSNILAGLNFFVEVDLEINGICMDSRRVQAGDLFVCIPGLQVDGHDFAAAAAEAGAAAIICQRPLDVDLPQFIVDNPRLALCTICDNFYGQPAANMQIIGITGTNGKTSTVYFVEQILRHFGKRVGAIGTLEAKLDGQPLDIPFATPTTPDTIELYRILRAMADQGAEYVVMEVSSHALALDKVMAIPFALGLFTNLSQDHLDFHGTMEKYLEAKSLLFSLSNEGIINADDQTMEYLLNVAKCPMRTFGIDGGDFRAEGVELGEDGVKYAVDGINIFVPIPGKFTVYNTLCAFAAALRLGFDPADITKALANLSGVPGRIQRIPNSRGLTVIVDFAHTPDSLANIITSCREFTAGRIITVFGCGGDRDPSKRPLMGETVGNLSDLAIITSDNPRNENPETIIAQAAEGVAKTSCEYINITDRRVAIHEAISHATPRDCVIIAGKGHEKYQEFENGRKIHFDDAQIAKKYMTQAR